MSKIEIDRLRTTVLGEMRIKRNLGLGCDDVVAWCKQVIQNTPDEFVVRSGKNWYVHCGDFVLTINANSYTIITAHKKKNDKTSLK
jgi:GDP-D-mannose dehydratase